FGIKVSGQYFAGEEYRFLDREELQQQRLAQACIEAGLVRGLGTCPTFTGGLTGNAEDLEVFRSSVRNAAGGRNTKLERWSGDVRADWRPSSDLSFIASGGLNQAGSSIDLTGLGAGQVVDWRYNYGQLRALYKDFFAQVFFNKSDNTETYLLRSGRPLIDRSSLLVGQLQNQSSLGGSTFTYGADFLRTVPQTEGTINGRNEEDDEITEVGAYVQSQTEIGSRLDLTLAARVDHHSILEDPVFSPRAALVFEPQQGQNFRVTYNRAFSTPTTLNLFLDISGGTIPLPAGLRYDVRAQGTTADGLHFQWGDNGLPMHRNPFAQFAGLDPGAYQETTTPVIWDEIAAVVRLQNEGLGNFMASLAPTDSDIAVEARTLDVQTQTFQPTPGGIGSIRDIPRVAPTITNTLELGYKGILADRLLLGANVYYSAIDDYTSALRVSTPNVFLNGNDVEAYLVANGLPAEQAAAAAVAISGDGTADNPGIPIGVMTPVEAGGTDPALILTYRNLGRVELFGADVSATVVLNDLWEASVGGAWVSDDTFTADEGLATEEDIPLNAPTLKGTASVRYRNPDRGLSGQVRGRFVNGFPANSAVYAGDVDGYGILDVTLGYRLPGFDDMTLTLDVSNVLNTGYQTFVGSPELGRFALLRLMYEF
ncbi:MAG TPA: TonB-dependent receptor, partial [Longimicrobiales bacterium]|nr:TonB-dependent receptor [Longimicrobiales bacterium]